MNKNEENRQYFKIYKYNLTFQEFDSNNTGKAFYTMSTQKALSMAQTSKYCGQTIKVLSMIVQFIFFADFAQQDSGIYVICMSTINLSGQKAFNQTESLSLPTEFLRNY